MSRQTVLRVMIVGFGLAVLLVIGAAYIGYHGSVSIQANAQDLVREHLVNTGRGAELESRIEQQSKELLDNLIWVLGVCFVLALAGSALTVWITDRAFRQLEWQAGELNRVSWHLVDTSEKTARRFSHEIHDELGQAIAGARAMLKRMEPQDFPSQRDHVLEILDEIMASVRELSQMLRPVILDDFGIDAGLRWLTERFSQRTNIKVEYESQFTGRLSDDLETHLFRIAQEALTNIARHSGASRVHLGLAATGRTIRLEIQDDGVGLQDAVASSQPSLGMVGMRARARQLDGDLKVANLPQGGLSIVVEVPLRGEEPDAA